MGSKIAIVGAGYWGKNLVRNFYEFGTLSVICDTNNLLEETYKQKYPDIHFTTSYPDVLGDKTVEAVAIATPAATHFILAMEALRAGKHVFVEKPLALKVEEGEQLVSFAREQSRILMVGHILQYHNAVLKLKELVDNGELGKVQYLCSNRLSIGKIRTEENILWSFAPHDISVILMLLNEEPEEIYATGGEYLQRQVADVTLTTMDFPSGVKAHIFVSWLHPFKEQKLVVIGDKKMAVFDDVGQDKLLLYPHKVQWLQRTPVASKAEAEIVPVDMAEPLKVECQHFLECIGNGCKPKTDGDEGLRVLRVLEASQRSINENNGRVSVGRGTKLEPHPISVQPPAPSYFAHESCYIGEDVEIGSGTKIWHFSHILTGSRIGKNCNIGQNVVIGPDVTVGNGCKIQNNVPVYKGVTLEDEVFCGPSVVFTNVYNPRAHIRRMDELRPTLARKGATLGANCTIVCGHTIGSYAFIGAGAVVTNDVPDFALMVGNPARRKGWMCACGIQISFAKDEAVCQACGRKYKKLKTEKIQEVRKEYVDESTTVGSKGPVQEHTNGNPGCFGRSVGQPAIHIGSKGSRP